MSTYNRTNRSISLRKSSNSLKRMKSMDIIFQRLQLYKYLTLFCCNSGSKGGDDDDVIVVSHQPRINAKDLEEMRIYNINIKDLESFVKGESQVKHSVPYKLQRQNGVFRINQFVQSDKLQSDKSASSTDPICNVEITETCKEIYEEKSDDVEHKSGEFTSPTSKDENRKNDQNEDDKFDIESGNFLSIQEIEDEHISDLEFKKTCYESSNICASYAKIFMIFEFISKGVDVCAVILLPLAIEIGFSIGSVIALICIFIPIILMQVLCDWSKLTEKYSELVYHFYILAASKAEDRVLQYDKLVGQFRSRFLYCDNLPLSYIKLPDNQQSKPTSLLSEDNITSQFTPSVLTSPTIS